MKIFLLSDAFIFYYISLNLLSSILLSAFPVFLFLMKSTNTHTHTHRQVFMILFWFLMYDSCGIPKSRAKHQQETRKLTLSKYNKNKRNTCAHKFNNKPKAKQLQQNNKDIKNCKA